MKLDDLMAKLGHRFTQPDLLKEALTHASYAHEHPQEGRDNERLEFLGDAVLDLLVGEWLFLLKPELNEGDMSKRRAHSVRKSSLARLGDDLGLRPYLRMGQGLSGENATAAVLADAFEAVMGALFCDSGYEEVKRCFEPLLSDVVRQSTQRFDFKTSLQEVCHRQGLGEPSYLLLDVNGPDHARLFTCALDIGHKRYGPKDASSKKAAQQACAQHALDDPELGIEPESEEWSKDAG
jgi:ribonuclease III